MAAGAPFSASDPQIFPPLPSSTPRPPEASRGNSGADPTKSISYAAALRPASPRAVKKNFEEVGDAFKQATIYNNKPGIFYTAEEVAGMAEPYCFSLIGKFSGQRPSYAAVLQAFKNFGLSSFFNLRFLRSGYIFIHLTSNEDMARVWTRGIWFIAGVPLRIFKWSPYFSYAAESSIVPVWIQLPDFPIHMFNKHSLFSAARIVGKPIKLDEDTADGTRLSMARVCVEIDLLKPKVEDFWIGIGEEKRLQQVVFEKHPKYCSQCLHLGHSEEECHALGNRPKQMWNPEKRVLAGAGDEERAVVNKKVAAVKEKEVDIASDDGRYIRRSKSPSWRRKEGVSWGNLDANNKFKLLADVENEDGEVLEVGKEALSPGVLKVGYLKEVGVQGQPSSSGLLKAMDARLKGQVAGQSITKDKSVAVPARQISVQETEQNVLVLDQNVPVLVSNSAQMDPVGGSLKAVEVSSSGAVGQGRALDLAAPAGIRSEGSEGKEWSRSFVEVASIEEAPETHIQRSSSLPKIPNEIPGSSSLILKDSVKDLPGVPQRITRSQTLRASSSSGF